LSSGGERLAVALARFDSVNAEDPRRERDPGSGEEIGFELLYARRMSERLARTAPDASEALRLAARAQHIARWRIPREGYPEGRAGYKRWRSELARAHADLAAEILAEVGYEAETIGRVRDLLTKKGLRHDAEVQTLEDVVCLVFLEHYFADFAQKHDRAKLVDIVQKTWNKMSPAGRQAALDLVPALPADLRSIVDEAVEAAG
jgi:Domain of unknown function (DUF4202)